MCAEEIRWSPYSRASCSIQIDETTSIGFGVHPVFDVVPGAWNIFWLTFAQLDQVAYYRGEIQDYLVTCDALAVCAGAAMQTVKTADGSTSAIGELAVRMKPKEFVEAVAKIPTFLPIVFYGEKWITVARRRAARYRVLPDNVIDINFRKGV